MGEAGGSADLMPRSARGFHKLVGGVAKRKRDLLADIRLGKRVCRAHPKTPAVGIVINALNQPGPACEACLQYGAAHGYPVERPEGD